MKSILLLLLFPCVQSLCSLPDNQTEVPGDWDPSDVCTVESFESIHTPDIRNLTTSTGQIKHDCGIIFVIDLDTRFTTELDFLGLQQFMKGVINSCQIRGVGNLIIFNKLFNDYYPPVMCCDGTPCDDVIDNLQYDDFVGQYTSTDPIQDDSFSENFTIAFLSDTKQLSHTSSICLYNTVVMVSNRIFNASEKFDNDVVNVEGYSCETITTIGIGNNITSKMMSKYYTNITPYQYVVPDFYCLPYLADCIKPCGGTPAKQCQDLQDAGNCLAPTKPPPTTTTTTTEATTTTESSAEKQSWHIIYLFALSNRTSSDDFNNAVNFIEKPLKDCLKWKYKILVRFLAQNNSDSGWLSDYNSIHNHLESLKVDEVLLDASPAIDVNDTVTLDLVTRAVNLPIATESKEEPRLTLLTDFVSQPFIDAYNQSDFLIKQMEKFDFEIYCFDQDAADIYKNQTVIKPNHIHSDPKYSDNKSYQVNLCKPKTSVPTIMLIIVGTCVGVMVILILVTILYRQKYMWSEKLNKFKSSQSGRAGEAEGDVIDYWELSWDKLIVKNERLGHGAYGQVFKGKLIGPSPGIEKFYRTEVGTYTDCDCAVKMLPRYASENARTEFMHEIQLMKTLGLHDNIVNMLGCITAGKSCLVLEYCANRDLLRYLKQKKVELEISKSMDDQIDLTKELMHLAWQIANGMRFLGDKNIIHRDLAARNILISGLEGLKNAKIGDFGLAMSSEPGEHALSASGRLPIKWLALESLQKEQFSFQSDVWSFGIVLFEMYSMGEIPFESVEPIELIPHLLQGNRPKPPLITPERISEMMLQCWHKDPQQRPTFQEMKDTLMTLLEQATEGYGYLALLKTSENYRVISEINEEYRDSIDEFYTDGPMGAGTSAENHDRISLASAKNSLHSRVQIDIDVKRRPSRKKTTTSSSLNSYNMDKDEEDENQKTWVAKVRRRKSQLAQLNPFRRIANLARSTSKGRTGSV